MNKKLGIVLVFIAIVLTACRPESEESNTATPSPTVIVSEPGPSPLATASAIPTPVISPKPTSQVTPKPSLLPSPSPTTTFDLNLENIILSTAPMASEPSWHGVIHAKGSGEFELERRQAAYAITVFVRNNGQVPAENVTYEVIVDGQSTKFVKDRIDQGTTHKERIMELPNDDKWHEVRVNISVDMLESNPHNNSHSFSYRIK